MKAFKSLFSSTRHYLGTVLQFEVLPNIYAWIRFICFIIGCSFGALENSGLKRCTDDYSKIKRSLKKFKGALRKTKNKHLAKDPDFIKLNKRLDLHRENVNLISLDFFALEKNFLEVKAELLRVRDYMVDFSNRSSDGIHRLEQRLDKTMEAPISLRGSIVEGNAWYSGTEPRGQLGGLRTDSAQQTAVNVIRVEGLSTAEKLDQKVQKLELTYAQEVKARQIQMWGILSCLAAVSLYNQLPLMDDVKSYFGCGRAVDGNKDGEGDVEQSEEACEADEMTEKVERNVEEDAEDIEEGLSDINVDIKNEDQADMEIAVDVGEGNEEKISS